MFVKYIGVHNRQQEREGTVSKQPLNNEVGRLHKTSLEKVEMT